MSSESVQLESLLADVSNIAIEFVQVGEKKSKVVDFRPGEELSRALDLRFPNTGISQPDLLALIRKVLDNSVNPWGKCFLDKLYTCTNPVGVVSELLLGVLNANSHVYKASPALTVVEVETARKLSSLFGLGLESGGLTMPGGSASNKLALTTAINNLLPDARKVGLAALDVKPVIFTSAHCHYSIDQAACTSGLGLANVRKIKTDQTGCMLVSDLEAQLQNSVMKGETPIFVCATAGTTVTGAFDPIREIAAVAKRFDCWFHVDASWGGALIFSEAHRDRLNGTELADSITFNPHKMIQVPLLCSFLLLRDKHKLHANNLNADYLFHGNTYDLGDGTTACGRRPDAFKFFLAWQAAGSETFGRSIDTALAHSARLAAMINSHPNLELVIEHDPKEPRLQVCFRYIPSYLLARGRSQFREQNSNFPTPPQTPEKSPPFTEETNKSLPRHLISTSQEIVRAIQGEILHRGNVMVDFCPVNSQDSNGEIIGDVFRLPMHPNVPFRSFELVLEEVILVGKHLYP